MALAQSQAQPTLEVTALKPASMSFTLSNVDMGVANALRRALIADVPTMGTHAFFFFSFFRARWADLRGARTYTQRLTSSRL
jgi:hypothetical protein